MSECVLNWARLRREGRFSSAFLFRSRSLFLLRFSKQHFSDCQQKCSWYMSVYTCGRTCRPSGVRRKRTKIGGCAGFSVLWQKWITSLNILLNSSFAASELFCQSKKTNFVADICLKVCSSSEERCWAKPFWQQSLSPARCLILWGFPFQGFSGDVPGSFSDPAFLSDCSAYADFASPPYIEYSPRARFYILQASCVFPHCVGKYVGDDWDIPQRHRSLGAP